MASSSKSRVLLACDSCRQRKSRCDGLRPCCSHCRQARRECIYRPTPTIESDATVLSRLDDAETRLQALEERNRILETSLRDAQSGRGEISEESQEPQQQHDLRDTEGGTPPPNLHTASASKMLHSWPRLHVNLRLPELDSHTYLALTDQSYSVLQTPAALFSTSPDSPEQPPSPLGAHSRWDIAQPRIMVWQARRALELFYSPDIQSQLPLALSVLFKTYPRLRGDHMIGSFSATGQQHNLSAGNDETAVDFTQLCFARLLSLSIAMRVVSSIDNRRTAAEDGGTGLLPAESMAIATETCRLALQQLWIIQASPRDDLVPQALAMAWYLVCYWVRPSHAFGLLQSIDGAIKHMSLLRQDDPRVTLYAQLHFILESDILTEIDGFPSVSCHTLIDISPSSSSLGSEAGGRIPLSQLLHADTVASPPSAPSSNMQTTSSSSTNFSETVTDRQYIENHARLRSLLNHILCLLYVPNKAYAQPHDLANLVRELAASLRRWYQTQPIDQQFARDAAILGLTLPAMPHRQRELARRYFACVFLLHRPVLYFFLHRDLEYTVRPPESSHTLQVARQPWVFESCRDCIESAALFISLSAPSHGSDSTQQQHPLRDDRNSRNGGDESWYSLQTLFAAYLVLLQVRTDPSLVPVLRRIDDVDILLDKVEWAFMSDMAGSKMLQRSLSILQNVRYNFK